MKFYSPLIIILLFASCNRHHTIKGISQLPKCLEEKIAVLKKANETPVYIKRYEYKGQTVYYIKSACCDQFNVVLDSLCNVLGYPDGGITGRGDGTLSGFRDNAKNGVEVWRVKEQ